MKELLIRYEEFESISRIPEDIQDLLRLAQKALPNAYAPYSGFHVAAAVRMKEGQVVTGINIENASYPVGTCAERVALGNALSQYPRETINDIAITYKGDKKPSLIPIFPCGMCRQFITEVELKNHHPISLWMGGLEGTIIHILSAQDLLPFVFDGSDL